MAQSNGDEVRKELERLYKCVVYDRIDDVDRMELWIKEVGIVVEELMRTEKLKLLDEVRERVVGEDVSIVGGTDANLENQDTLLYVQAKIAQNIIRSEQRKVLTKLEAEI